ncbi:MAG: hypothetical protein N2444_05080, partial [Methylocystis sp.]|nr:hypothetical protein [Methylocystis sp.]
MKQNSLLYLVLFLCAPLLVGCLLAPWVFLAVSEVHHFFPDMFGPLKFERVATRTVQILALLCIWPCLKYSGTLERVAPFLQWSPRRMTAFLRSFALGALMVAAVYTAGFISGYYEFDPDKNIWSWLAIPFAMLISTVLI